MGAKLWMFKVSQYLLFQVCNIIRGSCIHLASGPGMDKQTNMFSDWGYGRGSKQLHLSSQPMPTLCHYQDLASVSASYFFSFFLCFIGFYFILDSCQNQEIVNKMRIIIFVFAIFLFSTFYYLLQYTVTDYSF